MSTRLTIVTPSYQQGEFIEDTLKSVQEQDVDGLEQWVIDAGSTDASMDIVKDYASRYPGRLQWVSEPDNGQSDAINKGFRKASGDIVAWLNADDIYYPGVLPRVLELFDQRPEVDVVYGRGTFLKRDGAFVTEFPHNQAFDAERLLSGFAFLLQPTVFWRKSVLERVGYLNEDLHYGMDYDLWCRMARAGTNFFYDKSRYYAAARFYSETKTASGHWKRSREMRRIARSHSDRPLPAITFFSWLEALMATRPMRALYRPLKKHLHGLDIDYWEIPAPEAQGGFEVHFPWYRPLSQLDLSVACAGAGQKGEPPRLQVVREGKTLLETALTSTPATITVPWKKTDAHIAFTLTLQPADLRFRLLDVAVT